MTLQEAKTRLDEAMNWHQFGPNHDEDSWCCERENELRDEVFRLEAVGGATAAMSTPTRIWKIHTDPYPHLRENGETILARDRMPSPEQVAILEAAPALQAENTRLREALRCVAEATVMNGYDTGRVICASHKEMAVAALAAGKGTSPDLSADPAAYDRIADRELGPAAGKGETR